MHGNILPFGFIFSSIIFTFGAFQRQ